MPRFLKYALAEMQRESADAYTEGEYPMYTR